jgi:hypothetical protein
VRGSRLTCRSVANVVKAYAGRAGFDASTFSGHSLRSGFLTSAAGKGASIFKMMDVSRHQECGYPKEATSATRSYSRIMRGPDCFEAAKGSRGSDPRLLRPNNGPATRPHIWGATPCIKDRPCPRVSPTCAESHPDHRQIKALAKKLALHFFADWDQAVCSRAGKCCSARRMRFGRVMPRRWRRAACAGSGWVTQRRRIWPCAAVGKTTSWD